MMRLVAEDVVIFLYMCLKKCPLSNCWTHGLLKQAGHFCFSGVLCCQ